MLEFNSKMDKIEDLLLLVINLMKQPKKLLNILIILIYIQVKFRFLQQNRQIR